MDSPGGSRLRHLGFQDLLRHGLQNPPIAVRDCCNGSRSMRYFHADHGITIPGREGAGFDVSRLGVTFADWIARVIRSAGCWWLVPYPREFGGGAD